MHAVLACRAEKLLVLDEYGDGVRDMVSGKSTQPLGQRDFFQARRHPLQADVPAVVGAPRHLVTWPPGSPMARAGMAGMAILRGRWWPACRSNNCSNGCPGWNGAGSAVSIIRRDGQVLLRLSAAGYPLRSLAAVPIFSATRPSPWGRSLRLLGA